MNHPVVQELWFDRTFALNFLSTLRTKTCSRLCRMEILTSDDIVAITCLSPASSVFLLGLFFFRVRAPGQRS